jgi:hypothetical protein
LNECSKVSRNLFLSNKTIAVNRRTVSAFLRQRINNLRNWHEQKALAKKVQVAEVFRFFVTLKREKVYTIE